MRRILTVAAVALGLTLPLAPAAQAQAGPTTRSSGCTTPQTRQALRGFGDDGAYYLVPGGSFVGGTTGWQLTGSTTLSPQSEPYDVMGAGGGSLALSPGSSATTAPMCTTGASDRTRLFYRGSGRPGSTLTVSVTSRSTVSRRSSYTVTYHLDGSSSAWQLSPTMVIPDWTDASGTQQTTISVAAEGGTFQVDDVLVDPWRITTG